MRRVSWLLRHDTRSVPCRTEKVNIVRIATSRENCGTLRFLGSLCLLPTSTIAARMAIRTSRSQLAIFLRNEDGMNLLKLGTMPDEKRGLMFFIWRVRGSGRARTQTVVRLVRRQEKACLQAARQNNQREQENWDCGCGAQSHLGQHSRAHSSSLRKTALYLRRENVHEQTSTLEEAQLDYAADPVHIRLGDAENTQTRGDHKDI
jgi:hypothetical protein